MSLFQRLKRIVRRERDEAPPTTDVEAKVRIVTDSTADIPADIAAELGVTVVPLQVVFGSETFRDGVELTSEQFFERLSANKSLPTTSQPSVGEFQRVYDALSAGASAIVSIHLSSRFSGTVETARQAAVSIAGCPIEVVDSGTVSMAMGLAVMAAAKEARDGGGPASCVEAAQSVLRRERIAITVDTLEFLRKGGRIGRAQALVGGLLKFKPILTIRDGEAHPLGRVRSRRKALDEIAKIGLDGGPIEEAAVMHSVSPGDAEYVANRVKERFPSVTVHVGAIGPVIGVHGGPGIVGLVVVGAEARPVPPIP